MEVAGAVDAGSTAAEGASGGAGSDGTVCGTADSADHGVDGVAAAGEVVALVEPSPNRCDAPSVAGELHAGPASPGASNEMAPRSDRFAMAAS